LVRFQGGSLTQLSERTGIVRCFFTNSHRTHMTIKLIPGHFYRDRAGYKWCCFSLDVHKSEHAQANCVRTVDGRVEYFFADGRYDAAGKREHTLVEEIVTS
jgi:hypothetical protein